MNKTLWNILITENSMEVPQTSHYSHGLWNIKDNWRLYHRAGKADEEIHKSRPVTSHNIAGNTREKQIQMPKERSQKWSVDFHSTLLLKNRSKIRKFSDENIFRLWAFASLRLSLRVRKDVAWVSPRRKKCSETWGQEIGRFRSKSDSHWLCETTPMHQ